MLPRLLLLGLVFTVPVIARGQNLVINGDLEDTTAVACQFNLKNAKFDLHMAHATAFGKAQELDIIQTPECTTRGFGFPAQSGHFKVGLHQKEEIHPKVDAFALELSSPVIAGLDYTLTFYSSLELPETAGPVEVGLTSVPTEFGTLVASVLPESATAWTEFTGLFTAPVDATHLTVRQTMVVDSYTFVDNFQLVPAAECFLVVGDVPGQAPFVGTEHLFATQVGPAVESWNAVSLEALPEFALPASPTATWMKPGGAALRTPTAAACPEWMLDGHFAVQVLMWNPQVFPGLPEQWTAGLYLTLTPDGSVLAEPYGASVGGLQIGYELDTNAAGQPVIRFPFSIPGM